MPQLGESIAEATVVNFLVKAGDPVEADQDIIEVETNKATMSVTSPCTGTLVQVLAQEGESYPVGAVLGYLEVTAEEAAGWGLTKIPRRPAGGSRSNAVQNRAAPRQVEPTVNGLPVPAPCRWS